MPRDAGAATAPRAPGPGAKLIAMGRDAGSRLSPKGRWAILGVVAAVPVVVLFFVPRFGQDEGYHVFAGDGPCLGVPNAHNVLSNIPFTAVGAFGLAAMRRRARHAPRGRGDPGYAVFMAGVFLTGFGSAFYHLAPDNDSLLFDRLPIVVAVMGFVAALIAERTGWPAHPRRLLTALVAAGVVASFWWWLSEKLGRGDLRPYVVAQGGPLVLLPFLLALFPAAHTGTSRIGLALGGYVLAKIVEILDRPIHAATAGIMSGHVLKHYLAAAACLVLVHWYLTRRPAPAGTGTTAQRSNARSDSSAS